jgi:F0F1-type ATP synthase membrane subunit b/b'
MLRQDTSSIGPDPGFNPNLGAPQNGVASRDGVRGGLDIQRELNRLEEMILDSPRVPVWGRTLIDEEKIIEQLDLIRLSLPEAFHEADTISRHKEEIFTEAEQYAQEIIETAERRADQLLNETGIVRQAEMQAQQILLHVQEECEAIREQTITELDRTRRQAQQDLEEMQRIAIAECEEIQIGADDYADRTLQDMELQLTEMLRIIRNGRQQVQAEAISTQRRESSSGGNRGSSKR